jgi:hypothetical protein
MEEKKTPSNPPRIRDVSEAAGSQILQINLSRNTPQSWQTIFNKKWKGHMYNMKRSATCNGMYITLEAPAEEFLTYHRAPLERIIADTHVEYLEFEKQKALEEERAKQKAEEERLKRKAVIDGINKALQGES